MCSNEVSTFLDIFLVELLDRFNDLVLDFVGRQRFQTSQRGLHVEQMEEVEYDSSVPSFPVMIRAPLPTSMAANYPPCMCELPQPKSACRWVVYSERVSRVARNDHLNLDILLSSRHNK